VDGLPDVLRLVWRAAPVRSGASHAAIAPYGPFPCAGAEQVFLGIQNEREWATFCDQVLGTPELATDGRFVTNSLRVAHRADLTAEIAKAFAAVSADEAIDRLEEAGIANARLRDLAGSSSTSSSRPGTAGARSTPRWGRSRRLSRRPRWTAKSRDGTDPGTRPAHRTDPGRARAGNTGRGS
jgi:crotonobetainyl-CoA:carnitine CoA-transferase CaiB-like acyl-CoA transferase